MDLINECQSLPPGSKLSYTLRNNLEKLPLESRRQVVNKIKNGCAPLFLACKRGQLDIVVYLVIVCNADIEQKGIYEVPDDRSTHAVTPLWCAAVSGKLPVIKFLLLHGADINAVSDTGSTPVRSACFMTHLDIVTYLVQNGADINRPNFNGGTCLINSVQSPPLCLFLLQNGADVNATDIQSKTALHYAIQEHRLETTQLLLDHGANYHAKSRYGDDALQTSCLKGALDIFAHLTSRISYSDEVLANAYELLGSTFLDEHNDVSSALMHWRKAQAIREKNPACKLEKRSPAPLRAAYRYHREYGTMEELEELATDLDSVRMQSLLITERILGPHHKDTVFRLMFRGASYADVMRFQRCIDLWRRVLEVRVERDTILYADTSFTAQAVVRFLVDYNERHIPAHNRNYNHEQRMEDVLAAFKSLTNNIQEARQLLTIRPQNKRQMDNFDKILKCITYLIFLMLQLVRTDQQMVVVTKLITDLIRINPRSATTEDTLLHLCVSKLNVIKSGYFLDEEPLEIFPRMNVIHFLLKCGANINARNDSKSTPLHVATVPYNCNNWLVQLLLDNGAHLDQPNASGEMPLHKVNESPFNLDLRILQYVNLKCLCARAVATYKIPYKNQIPKTVEDFVEAHMS